MGGGGMRQGGILAAAGLVALGEGEKGLENLLGQIEQEIEYAAAIRRGLETIEGIRVAKVLEGARLSNMCYFGVEQNLAVDDDWLAEEVERTHNVFIKAGYDLGT